MSNKPFRTTPALLLSLPGVALLLGTMGSLQLMFSGVLDSRNQLIPNTTLLIIGAAGLLILATLITTPIALFYSLRRTGNGLRRTFFVVLNTLLLLSALVSLASLVVALLALGANPG